MSMTKRLDGRTYSTLAEAVGWSTDICTDGWLSLSIQVIQTETVATLETDWTISGSNDGVNWVDTGLTPIEITGTGSGVFLDVDVTPRYLRIVEVNDTGTGDLSFKVNAKGSAD
jgi:hypothetical protein